MKPKEANRVVAKIKVNFSLVPSYREVKGMHELCMNAWLFNGWMRKVKIAKQQIKRWDSKKEARLKERQEWEFVFAGMEPNTESNKTLFLMLEGLTIQQSVHYIW